MTVQIGGQPQADFTQPIQLLMDCHRRIEHFLGILQKVVDQFGRSELNDEARRALAAALDYFAHAGPNHTADEEESLFPRLRQEHDVALVSVIEQAAVLERDHRHAEVIHARIERLGRAWLAEGLLSECDLAVVREDLRLLSALYAAHIAFEDDQLFPAAATVLNQSSIRSIGREMAQRRGLTPSSHWGAAHDAAIWLSGGSSMRPRRSTRPDRPCSHE